MSQQNEATWSWSKLCWNWAQILQLSTPTHAPHCSWPFDAWSAVLAIVLAAASAAGNSRVLIMPGTLVVPVAVVVVLEAVLGVLGVGVRTAGVEPA